MHGEILLRFHGFTSQPLSILCRGDAPRRLRIYTRTGDKGQSSLYNGKRESKAATVFSALGDTDELNANIGVAFEACAALAGAAPDEQWLALLQRLGYIQSRLLDVGSAIATPLDSSTEEQLRRAAFPDGAIGELERWIDEMELSLPVLRNFILPVRMWPARAFSCGVPILFQEQRTPH